MAPEKKDKKRKGKTAILGSHDLFKETNNRCPATAVSDAPAKKTKKVEAKAAEATKDTASKPILKKKQNGTAKPKETKVTTAPKTNGEPARQVKPRKRAADFLSDEEEDEATAPAPAPSKKSANKKTKKESESVSAGKKGASKAKKVEVPEESEEEAEDLLPSEGEGESEDEDEGEDDQTAALIKGFESSGDEGDSGDEGYNPDKPVPKIPDSKKAQKKIMKKQKEDGAPEEPGTVYIGYVSVVFISSRVI